MVHNGRYVPSDEVIRREIEDKGMDYRFTPAGEHPVEALRVRDRLPGSVARQPVLLCAGPVCSLAQIQAGAQQLSAHGGRPVNLRDGNRLSAGRGA